MLRLGGEERTICAASSPKLPGIHNVYNALSAPGVGQFMGVPPQVAAYSLKVFEGVEHRIEFVRELDGVKYYNDSMGTNPDATITAIRSKCSPTVLIMGGHDKQTPFNQLAKSAKSSPLYSGGCSRRPDSRPDCRCLKQTSLRPAGRLPP